MSQRSTSIPSAFSSSRDHNAVPVVFQVVSPDNSTLLLPDFLYLHVNPDSFEVSYTQQVERFQTMGGFVEQHFGEQLSEVSGSQSSGVFMSVEDGITRHNRTDAVAYRKTLQLIDVFKSNGSVYDDKGMVRFKGRIRIVFGYGTYDGFFTTFEVSESAESPFSLQLSWAFTVEKERYDLLY